MSERPQVKCLNCNKKMICQNGILHCSSCGDMQSPNEHGFAICQICGEPLATVMSASPETTKCNCPKCGQYACTPTSVMERFKKLPRHILSGVTRNYHETTGNPFTFTNENTESMEVFYKTSPIPIPNKTDIPAKADLILHHIRRKTNWPGGCIQIYPSQNTSIAFCERAEELEFCINYLVKQEFVIEIEPECFGDSPAYCITPDGWAYLSGIGVDVKEQGFIAMAFGLPTSDTLYKTGLFDGILNAGYKPLRIDSKEHINKIDDEIVAEIRKSKFVVADLTGKNAGAYFEAGFAMGLGRPVIWTCSKTDLEAHNGVHFDTRQYCVVPWEPDALEDFAKRLTFRIEATIGRGKFVQDPAI